MRVFLISLILTGVMFTDSAFSLGLQDRPIDRFMKEGLVASSWRASLDEPFKTEGQSGQPGSSFDKTSSGHKSLFKAAALSAIIPGGGQLYVGNKKTARYFLATEVITWIGYASFKTYANWKENDFVRYAATHANAQMDGKSDEFIDLVGFYSDIDEYNRLGRAFDPEREFLADTPENHWRWKDEADRYNFRGLKNRSREADRRAEFMIGIAIVDRVISVIDAVRGARRANHRLRDSFTDAGRPAYKLSVNPFSSRRQVNLTVFIGQ